MQVQLSASLREYIHAIRVIESEHGAVKANEIAKKLRVKRSSVTGALKSLFAVAEAYPELKASENFKQLQEELADTETKVASSRQFYNANVLDLNTKIQTFPSVILAGIFGFKEAEFFGATEGEKKPVKVSF